MSTVQLIFLFLGIIVILSSLDFSTLLQGAKQNIKSPTVQIDDKNALVNIVQKWEILKDSCKENNLTEAVAKLDEIFPMLIKVDK